MNYEWDDVMGVIVDGKQYLQVVHFGSDMERIKRGRKLINYLKTLEKENQELRENKEINEWSLNEREKLLKKNQELKEGLKDLYIEISQLSFRSDIPIDRVKKIIVFIEQLLKE